jgi:hypothetical protein
VLGEPPSCLVLGVDTERRFALAHLLDAARRERLLTLTGDQRGGGTRMPPQSFMTIFEIASTPLASRAEMKVVPHCLDRLDVNRAVKVPDAVLVAAFL